MYKVEMSAAAGGFGGPPGGGFGGRGGPGGYGGPGGSGGHPGGHGKAGPTPKGGWKRSANEEFARKYPNLSTDPSTGPRIAREMNKATGYGPHGSTSTRSGGVYIRSPSGSLTGSLHHLGPSSASGMIHAHTMATKPGKDGKASWTETVRLTPEMDPALGGHVTGFRRAGVGGSASAKTNDFAAAFGKSLGSVARAHGSAAGAATGESGTGTYAPGGAGGRGGHGSGAGGRGGNGSGAGGRGGHGSGAGGRGGHGRGGSGSGGFGFGGGGRTRKNHRRNNKTRKH